MTQTPPPDLPLPGTEHRRTVFISYSHHDESHAQKLIADLEAAGHVCWIVNTDIKGGDDWVKMIAEGINNSYALVPIISENALRSEWMRKEILWAQKKQVRIIPWATKDLTSADEFILMVDCQWLTVFEYGDAAALEKLLRALPNPAQLSSKTGVAPAIESQLRPTSQRRLRREAELGYLDFLQLKQLAADKYTPLGGDSQQWARRLEMPQTFELLRFGQLRDERRLFENAVEEICRIRRAVLLGEPGSGKTSTLRKLSVVLAETAEQDPSAPLPLFIELGKWDEAAQSLEDFIAAQLGPLGDALGVLLSNNRAALLLDGLNELPTSQRAEKYAQVQRFIEQHPQLLAVVSCRELDYTIDLGFDRINIMPLDPLRIREFAGHYLGDEKGEALFWRLAGGDEVRATWEVWERVGASFEMFWTAPDIPKENPNVYGATSGQQDRVWREKVRGKHTLMELAGNPYMLLMLTSVYAEQGELPENRGELFQLFVETLLKRERIPASEETALTEGLARVAYEMQIRRVTDEVGDALTVLPRAEVDALLGERVLYLAASASMLSVGEQVRFTHQLLQEYFAAKYMAGEITAGQLQAKEIWPPDRWWERTNWEEAAILLAGLYRDDCTPIVEWIAKANPEVAAQCVMRSGAVLAAATREATRERWRSQWIPRLTDLHRDPNPAARAAVGRALGLTGWDNRKGVGIAEFTGSEGRTVLLPDIDWVEIPSGEFQYGDESEYAAKPQRLTLPTFQISRYPVTYAQFQTFLDDPEGYANPRWFAGMAAGESETQVSEQSFKFANHPRESVNWYQALAFCRWFSWRLGSAYDLQKVGNWAVRLPTEYEWEKSARGTDGRLYPYAGEFDAAKGNTYETGIHQTSAVGIFPQGASPYGVLDLCGNVWEWCLSNYDKPTIEVRKENLRTEKSRVLRGGSWFSFLDFARAVFRSYGLPASRFNVVGFRVVVSRPPSS